MDPTKQLPPAQFSPIEPSNTTDQLMRLPLDYNIPPQQAGFDFHPGYISPDRSSHSDSKSDSHSSFESEDQSDSASDADSDSSDIEIIISEPKPKTTPFQMAIEPRDKKPLIETPKYSPESSELLPEPFTFPNPFLFQEPKAIGHPAQSQGNNVKVPEAHNELPVDPLQVSSNYHSKKKKKAKNNPDPLQVSSNSHSKKKKKAKNNPDPLQVSSNSHSKKKKKTDPESDPLQVSSNSHSKKKKKTNPNPNSNPIPSSKSHSKKKKKSKTNPNPDSNPIPSSKSHLEIKPEVSSVTSQIKKNLNEDTLSRLSNPINKSRHPFENCNPSPETQYRSPSPETRSILYAQDFALKRLCPDDLDYHSSMDPCVNYQANKSNNIKIHHYQNDHRKVPQEAESVIFPSREPAAKIVKKPKQKAKNLVESEHKQVKVEKTQHQNQVHAKQTDVVKETEIPKAVGKKKKNVIKPAPARTLRSSQRSKPVEKSTKSSSSDESTKSSSSDKSTKSSSSDEQDSRNKKQNKTNQIYQLLLWKQVL
ncbi:uncharacterized protein MELLADRAFT_67017 [Melampsora larici-populina 98AG31]|uniref:Uncharacterized protein n=1 Tax=Melampsora larici-populina (strain 98AG31 / pathotype 3-4-7) TaxID=747676 RepID=F4S1H5_MELLP|nr:uncharacterized protein MELLADRAFT_67017 [Melampsora larici-populina 98AG31]EGG01375.1 hypothetical protein MELLADRAFT_67017 [Melampsora larici-populina 98AG31]